MKNTEYIAKVLVTEEEIQARVKEMAAEINEHYRKVGADELIVIGILRGAVVLMVDLIRELELPLKLDFMSISSYGGGTTSSGNVRVLKDAAEDICGKHVLIVEDIVDTGNTLQCLLNLLQAREPASLKVCALLDKPARRKVDIKADFSGFDIPDEFVVGYGLDFDSLYRDLPFIGVLKPEYYTK